MKATRLIETTVFRLTLLYSVIFGILASGVFVLISWSNTNFVETQTRQRLETETSELQTRYSGNYIDALVAAINNRSANADVVNWYYLLVNQDGERLAGNLAQWPQKLTGPSNWLTFRRDLSVTGDGLDWDRDEFYEIAAQVTEWPDGHRLLVGRGLYEAAELREQSLGGLLLGSIVTVLLSLVIGSVLGRSMVSRVSNINATLADIMAGNLSRRIRVGRRDDEFGRLTTQINRMLDRFEQLVAALREVTSNVSHDLRTPLHRLRNRLELLLVSDNDENDRRMAIERAVADIDEILATFNVLLSIAEAEAELPPSQWGEVDVGELATNLAELYAAPAEEQGLRLECSAQIGLKTLGNTQLLGQAISNLLENAIKYTPRGGLVQINTRGASDGFDLLVSDTGPGIPESDRERVLQRFQRLDSARITPGNGLGLSLVNAVAKLHGARLVLESNQPGLRVRLRFSAPFQAS